MAVPPKDERTWKALAQLRNRGSLLLLSDLLILLLVGRSPESLPRKAAPQEVHEHMTQRL